MATLTLPSITITSPASTGITATPVAPLNGPLASGTVVFNCVVAPANWVGSVAYSGSSNFAVANLSGNSFQIVTTVSLNDGTYTTGTLTSTP